MSNIQLPISKAREMRAAMNTTAAFLKSLYMIHGEHLHGVKYANLKISELCRLAKHLDKEIKRLKQ